MELKLRETVILVEEFDAQIKWYFDMLEFKVVKVYEVDFHFPLGCGRELSLKLYN